MTRTLSPAAVVSLVALTALLAGAATPAGPAVGAWATYQWSSSLREEVPVLVRQDRPGAQPTWTVAKDSVPPAPLFATYSIVRADPKTYTMQITTHATADGPPLSVTQVQVDRASGKALRTVIKAPKGAIGTPDSGFRPLRQAAVKGTEESVAVPAGRFTAVKTTAQNGTVWVSDQVPALGLVKGTFPSGTLELLRSGTAGAKDLLRS
jgi:hypothetical protein